MAVPPLLSVHGSMTYLWYFAFVTIILIDIFRDFDAIFTNLSDVKLGFRENSNIFTGNVDITVQRNVS